MTTNKHLILSGIVFTILLFIWPIFIGISQPKGSEIEQLNWILTNLTLYKLQFFFAFLISPSIIYMALIQLDKYPRIENISMRIGLIFITGYAILTSISYASQIILVPKLIETGFIEHAKFWYFGSSISITYFIDQMGYSFWGIGTIILFSRFINGKGIMKYLSIIYLISAILSIIAFIGLILDNKTLNSMTSYSGLVLIPVGILTIIWGYRENKKCNGVHQTV